jgi:hypothetical protein
VYVRASPLRKVSEGAEACQTEGLEGAQWRWEGAHPAELVKVWGAQLLRHSMKLGVTVDRFIGGRSAASAQPSAGQVL